MSPLSLVEIVILAALAAAALALGGAMALKPAQRTYESLRPVSVALVFGMVGLTLTGLTNLAVMLSRNEWSDGLRRAASSGVAELLIPSLLGFGVLTVAWGLASIGLRRLD
jgi:hypothetical protein